jgi:hypothetical protein
LKSTQQKVGATMQETCKGKPVTRPFRVFFKILIGIPIALTSIVAVLYLILLAWSALLRLKWVSDKTRRLSKTANVLPRRIAGSRLGIMYFNLSALKHVGRSSGREYVTPLAAYPLGDGFVLALAYGPDVDWCRNVLAAGKCTLIWRGHEYTLEKPEIIPASEALGAYPLLVKPFVVAAGMKQFLWVHKQREVPEKAIAGV